MLKRNLFFLAIVFAFPAAVLSQSEEAVFHQDVVWSPDGTRLAYSEMRMTTVDGKRKMNADVFVVNADGTRGKKLTGDKFNEYFVSWAPDGKSVVFGAADPESRLSDIYSVKTDGSGLRRLTDGAGRNSQPSLSPDGKRIAFASTRDTEKFQIYVMSADGTGLKRLTDDDDVAHYNPQWSPDGARIVYYAEKGDSKDQVWTINTDGSDPLLMTNGVAHNIFPAYTPGGRIIFCSNRDGEEGAVYTMGPDGSDVRRIEGIASSWARISPDGKRLAWIGGRWPKSAIYVSNVDGSGKKKIVGGEGN